MLQLRPICENCAKPLPPQAEDACICSYECTFCANCVETILHNVCPNCGGGFEKRPVRPATAWCERTSLSFDPAATERKHKPLDSGSHDLFSQTLRAIAPAKR